MLDINDQLNHEKKLQMPAYKLKRNSRYKLSIKTCIYILKQLYTS